MNLFKKRLIQDQCIDTANHVNWSKVAENPVLVQHALLHMTQKCNDARFLPQEIVCNHVTLIPLALAFASHLVVPLKSAPTPNTNTLLIQENASKTHSPPGTLSIGVLDD